MHKIWLISKREYLTRVKKKSFIIMTILSPVLIALFYGIIIYLSFNKEIADDSKHIIVSDQSGLFTNQLKSNKSISFSYRNIREDEAKSILKSGQVFGVIMVSDSLFDKSFKIKLLVNEQPSLSTLTNIENQFEVLIKNKKLSENGIDQKILSEINSTGVEIETRKLTDSGLESGNSGVTTFVGIIGAILIYFFIFLYGVQVMKGVIEEKTNRIVEVLISSVKPFELMMGKIIGIALVGLTQFVLWVIMVLTLTIPVSMVVANLMNISPETIAAGSDATRQSSGDIAGILSGFGQFNYTLIIGMFIFYFIGGYLFYGALFAAVGSAVDSETDTQQFMMPMTLPLIFSFALAQSIVVNAPNGQLAIWLSIIPLSSPVVMMVRLPFGVPTWQIITSMVCMALGFMFTVWLAGRIYRIGILTFGKKPTYKEIWVWLFRKN
ncbi:MAG: ABC transporter permease [Bacteroidota bacterium]|nr:ABC transporter permease [Bacteroidota bacterium]